MNNYTTVEEYLNDLKPETRLALLEMRECIFEVVPDAEELFNYNILAYTLEKGGKRDKQVMIAGYAKHVGFYPHPTTIEYFEGEIIEKNYKYGKGSVQFPIAEPIPKELILRMIRKRKEMVDAG